MKRGFALLTLLLIAADKPQPTRVLEGHSDIVTCLACDRGVLASGSKDTTVRLWDMESGKTRHVLKGHTRMVTAVAFSPDGRIIATSADDRLIRLWDVATGKEKAVLKGHRDDVHGLAFAPDGKTLASASGDYTVRLWDLASEKEVASLAGHTEAVNDVAFSPDGKTLASAGWDKTVRLWDVETKKERAQLEGHAGMVRLARIHARRQAIGLVRQGRHHPPLGPCRRKRGRQAGWARRPRPHRRFFARRQDARLGRQGRHAAALGHGPPRRPRHPHRRRPTDAHPGVHAGRQEHRDGGRGWEGEDMEGCGPVALSDREWRTSYLSKGFVNAKQKMQNRKCKVKNEIRLHFAFSISYFALSLGGQNEIRMFSWIIDASAPRCHAMGEATSNAGIRWRRILLRVCLVLAILYVLFIGVLLAFEDRFVYRPNARGGYWAPAPEELAAEDVWLTSADGTDIHAWWCPVKDSDGATLFCHGNAGNLSNRSGDIRNIRDGLGQSVLIFDYPGFGKSGGTPSEAGCYAAADAAYDWLAKRVPGERIVLFGQSLGGGVAVDLAARRPHRGLVLFKTFTSVPDVAQAKYRILPARLLVRNRFDSIAKIEGCRRPLFVAHGDRDGLIPFAQGQRLFEAAPGPAKEFMRLPGATHNGEIPLEVTRQAAAFLREHGVTKR